MFFKPSKANIHIWRRTVVWGMLATIYGIGAIMAWADFSLAVNWCLYVIGTSIGTFVVIYRLHTLRENHRSAYAIIEITMAIVVIVLVFANALHNLGVSVMLGRWVPLIGAAASAVYFSVRAWDNLYQSELKKGSKLGRWMELWIVEWPVDKGEQKKNIFYPWHVEKANSPPPE